MNKKIHETLKNKGNMYMLWGLGNMTNTYCIGPQGKHKQREKIHRNFVYFRVMCILFSQKRKHTSSPWIGVLRGVSVHDHYRLLAKPLVSPFDANIPQQFWFRFYNPCISMSSLACLYI